MRVLFAVLTVICLAQLIRVTRHHASLLASRYDGFPAYLRLVWRLNRNRARVYLWGFMALGSVVDLWAGLPELLVVYPGMWAAYVLNVVQTKREEERDRRLYPELFAQSAPFTSLIDGFSAAAGWLVARAILVQAFKK